MKLFLGGGLGGKGEEQGRGSLGVLCRGGVLCGHPLPSPTLRWDEALSQPRKTKNIRTEKYSPRKGLGLNTAFLEK